MSAPPTISLQDFLSRRLEQRIEEMRKVLGYLQLTSDWRTARMVSQSIRECEAARQIVDLHREAEGAGWCIACVELDASNSSWPCPTIRALAAAYSDRADYHEEWKA